MLREHQKQKRRERIFKAALALFREKGFQATTAGDIAKEARVSRGTFFNYFPYKEAVLLDYGNQLLTRLKEEALRRLAQGRNPLEVLQWLWDELAEGTMREKELLMPLFYELLNPDPLRAKAAFEALPLGDFLAELFSPLRKAHSHSEQLGARLRQDLSLERIGHTLADLYFLTALRWAAYTPEKDLKEEMRKTLSLFLKGALAR